MEDPSGESLFIKGGPFRKFLVRRGWVRSGSAGLMTGAAACAIIAWLPLLLLSAAHGLASGDSVQIPFLQDFASHIRFLFAVPLLIVAEIPVYRRLGLMTAHFVRSGLVAPQDLPSFYSSVKKISAKLINSVLPLALFLLLALLGFFLNGMRMEPVHPSTWRMAQTGAMIRLTAAGWWYASVSLPLYRFLLYLWLWRLAVWTGFLWRVSRMKLNLNPTHPDLAGGLGFLTLAQEPFGLIIFASASVISAALAQNMMFAGASLSSFKFLITGFVFLSVLLFMAPLFLFTGKLYNVKKKGLLEYGAFASIYTEDFAQKWIGEKTGESPLGSPDIQSLSDLANSFQIVRKMKLAPFDLEAFVPLLAGAAVPMLPLVLISFPLDEIVAKIIRLVF